MKLHKAALHDRTMIDKGEKSSRILCSVAHRLKHFVLSEYKLKTFYNQASYSDYFLT